MSWIECLEKVWCPARAMIWVASWKVHVGPGLPHSDWGSYKKFQKVMQPLETSWHSISQLQLLKSASFPHHIKTNRHQSNGNASCHKLTENTHEHDWTCINMSEGANIKINILNESPERPRILKGRCQQEPPCLIRFPLESERKLLVEEIIVIL